jgi:hypothetical protein
MFLVSETFNPFRERGNNLVTVVLQSFLKHRTIYHVPVPRPYRSENLVTKIQHTSILRLLINQGINNDFKYTQSKESYISGYPHSYYSKFLP